MLDFYNAVITELCKMMHFHMQIFAGLFIINSPMGFVQTMPFTTHSVLESCW